MVHYTCSILRTFPFERFNQCANGEFCVGAIPLPIEMLWYMHIHCSIRFLLIYMLLQVLEYKVAFFKLNFVPVDRN